ncbi:TetR/AcrR family transcriptional regulator [Mycolicibacterium sp. S2-37]|uniref:TetR/AcrR family transcriptional regulator n=1 Tax=Mycolicibacterium sp. S2-37 TaxID=2810297 RepID=UPI001A94C93A|nr:TetR/AcrR family transcriptional regulator [Mycolicibacterium sp. S2-37]MBO0679512.1 TetR/AcrR family transcriptional regulator [Mycolicibacterium sp. S2-37]
MQPQSPTDDERERIIDAAYDCIAEPHTGPVPIAAILARAEVSTRAFYRHFTSKDELFLQMLRQESAALSGRLDQILDGGEAPPRQLEAWIAEMLTLAHDPRLRQHMRVIDSDEVRAAKGYREVRESTHTQRERSLVEILERGRGDGSFPLAEPELDAVAISALVSRIMTATPPTRSALVQRTLAQVLDFALRAVGGNRVGVTGR